MLNIFKLLSVLYLICISTAYARDFDGPGQAIQINTRLNSFLGKPTWLLVIRDVDNGENFPYLYDFRRGDNFWMAFTYSSNYLIIASTLTFETYQSRWNLYRKYKINNFCQLESNGRIIHSKSMHITITGNLTPNTNAFYCNVMRFYEGNFPIVNY